MALPVVWNFSMWAPSSVPVIVIEPVEWWVKWPFQVAEALTAATALTASTARTPRPKTLSFKTSF
jgi:hypothetical protein